MQAAELANAAGEENKEKIAEAVILLLTLKLMTDGL